MASGDGLERLSDNLSHVGRELQLVLVGGGRQHLLQKLHAVLQDVARKLSTEVLDCGSRKSLAKRVALVVQKEHGHSFDAHVCWAILPRTGEDGRVRQPVLLRVILADSLQVRDHDLASSVQPAPVHEGWH